MGEHDCGNDAAAYALGALEPAEARAFERHMESCAVCRDEVAAYALAADVLPLAAPQLEAPRALRGRVMREVRHDSRAKAGSAPSRKRVPPRLAFGFATALAAAAALVIALSVSTGGSGTKVIQANVGSAQLQVSGGHGQLVVAHLPAPHAGRIYELWIQHGRSAPSPSTLFSVDRKGTADIGVPGALHGVTHVLVTNEPAAGSRAPTTRPLIIATLS